MRRFAIWAAAYGTLLAVAFWFSYDLRFYESGGEGFDQRSAILLGQRGEILPWVMALKLLLLWVFGQFKHALVKRQPAEFAV
jgi:H+/Cl- antiporter ClcA